MVNIEELQELPKFLGMKFSEKVSNNKSKHYLSWFYRYNRKYYIIVNRILENNIGKSFDLAFSYYCKKVNKQYQYLFLEEFQERRWSYYYVDEFGNIQYNNSYIETKKPIIIPSKDYQYELVHKITGKKHNEWSSFHKNYNIGDWERVTISGCLMIFESENDPRLKRIRSEKQQARRKTDRFLKKEKKERQYSFLTKLEKDLIAQRQQDLIKRDSHGFDENSFKGIEYHGRKKKNY